MVSLTIFQINVTMESFFAKYLLTWRALQIMEMLLEMLVQVSNKDGLDYQFSCNLWDLHESGYSPEFSLLFFFFYSISIEKIIMEVERYCSIFIGLSVLFLKSPVIFPSIINSVMICFTLGIFSFTVSSTYFVVPLF